jgi:uncharacterized protein YlxW (UPF0749 family)
MERRKTGVLNMSEKLPENSQTSQAPSIKPKTKTEKQNAMISFSLALTLLSFAIVCQINFESNSLQSLENQSTDTLVAVVRNLNDYRSRLNTELETLEQDKSSLSITNGLEQQMQNARVFAGSVPVTGPGVSVTITADYELYSMDIIDIANELKVSGAEAIAVNNQRLTAKTKLAQETDQNGNLYLTMNGERLLTPIVITAIGDSSTLEKGLVFTGGIIDNLNTLYGIYPIVRQEEVVTIPATSLNTSPSYMKNAASSTQ